MIASRPLNLLLALTLLAAVAVLTACSSAAAANPTAFPTATGAAIETTTAIGETVTGTPEPGPSVDEPATATPELETPAGQDAPAPALDTPAPALDTPAAPPEPTALPTQTPLPTPSPTSRPQEDPTPAVVGAGTLDEGVPTPVTPIPTPVPVFELPDEITNILLIGKDSGADGSESARTDTMIIVSINRETGTASMVSLPRDLLVYLPTRTMSRLNTAYVLGGVDLLKQAILYNFGIPIHYYAQVDFDGFKQAVDIIGGVDLIVSCPLTDWRLISPELDPTLEENWERFTLEAGLHHLDGDAALWFARSRLSTSDFDRGRRQQQLLRALLSQSVNLDLVSRAPELWSAYSEVVETDMDVGRILQLATMAPTVNENGIQNLYLAGKTQAWTVPESGAQVQLPVWEGENMMKDTFRRLFLPPALNRADHAPITVEIINATEYPAQAWLAADNLAWYGFVPIIGEPLAEIRQQTEITYNADNFKGSYDWLLSWVMDSSAANIQLAPDENYPYNYRVVLGQDYNPCRPAFLAPQANLPAEE